MMIRVSLSLSLSLVACRVDQVDASSTVSVEEQMTDTNQHSPEAQFLTLRDNVPSCAAPDTLAQERTSLKPTLAVPRASRPLVDATPLVDQGPNSPMIPLITRVQACEIVAGGQASMKVTAQAKYASGRAVLAWEDSDEDGAFDTLIRFEYDTDQRLVRIAREVRLGDRCRWHTDHVEFGYDEHGAVVSTSMFDRDHGLVNVRHSREYDPAGHVLWIHEFHEISGYPMLLKNSLALDWSDSRVRRVDQFDAEGRWTRSRLAAWTDEFVRVDVCDPDGHSAKWNFSTILRRETSGYDVVYMVEGNGTVTEDFEFNQDGDTSTLYRGEKIRFRTLHRPDRSKQFEEPDPTGKMVVVGGERYTSDDVLEHSINGRTTRYRYACGDFNEPEWPPLPAPGECPTPSQGVPVFGPDESDR